MRRVRVLVLTVAAVVAALVTAVVFAAPGDLDPSFGLSGVVEGHAPDLVLQPDGKIIGGSVRYNPDGSIDTSFGTGGIADSGGDAVVLQPDGKIVFRTGSGLSRSNSDGSLDASFGTGGSVTVAFGPSEVLLQPDGKIIAVGTLRSNGDSGEFALTRYNGDGTLDVSFGSGGTVTTEFLPDTTLGSTAFGATLQPDGKIVAVGNTAGVFSPTDLALARYNPDGSLDTSFGNGGRVTTDASFAEVFTSVVIQPEGKIVAAGSTEGFGFTVLRYNPDGSQDSSWGAAITFAGINGELANDLAIQRNGKIVVAGRAAAWPEISGDFNWGYGLARLNADGSLDNSFGDAGKLLTDFGDGAFGDGADSVLIQPDGKIVAGGGSGLVRYLGDPTFFNVRIDVNPPADARNTINLPKGVVWVAVLSSSDFEASTLDPSTVCFGDADAPIERDCSAEYPSGQAMKDINADGKPDLLMRFQTAQTGIDLGDTTACLTGVTRGGLSVEGCDSISTK